jgi:hypothetical protein
MIIWGFRVIFRTLSTGTFFCPKEDADRGYKLRVAQRFFTLFFIPLIPLKKLGNVVQCDGCNTRFDENVLTIPTTSQRGDSLAGTVRSGAVAMLRAGAASSTGRDQATRLVSGYLPDYSESQLASDLTGLDIDGFQGGLQSASAFLDEHGKEGLLTRFALVGLADKGSLTDAERSLLTDIGERLGMTTTHCRGVIDAAIDQVNKH